MDCESSSEEGDLRAFIVPEAIRSVSISGPSALMKLPRDEIFLSPEVSMWGSVQEAMTICLKSLP